MSAACQVAAERIVGVRDEGAGNVRRADLWGQNTVWPSRFQLRTEGALACQPRGKLASASAALGSNAVRRFCTLKACNVMDSATQGGALRASPGLACRGTFGADVFASPYRELSRNSAALHSWLFTGHRYAIAAGSWRTVGIRCFIQKQSFLFALLCLRCNLLANHTRR